MAEPTHTIFEEIDEALKADKALQFWNEHKQTIIGCCVAVVLGTAASVVWQNYQNGKAEEATLAMVKAQVLFDDKKYTEAAGAFGKVGTPIATIKQAQAMSQNEQRDKAALLLAKGGSDKGINGLMKVQSAVAGGLDEENLRSAAQDGKPFSPSAKELLALHYLKQGKQKEAEELLVKIENDKFAPATLRGRTEQILHVIKQ